MSELQLVENRITELKTELQELEVTARVLRRFVANGRSPGRRRRRSQGQDESAPRLTIVEAAKRVLAGGVEVHYLAIAEQAIKHGYRGKKGSTAKMIAKSFWSTMKAKKNHGIFEATGGGKFRLR